MAALRWPEKQSARGLETAPKACIGVPCTAQTPASYGFGACLTLLIAISLEQTSATEPTTGNRCRYRVMPGSL